MRGYFFTIIVLKYLDEEIGVPLTRDGVRLHENSEMANFNNTHLMLKWINKMTNISFSKIGVRLHKNSNFNDTHSMLKWTTKGQIYLLTK